MWWWEESGSSAPQDESPLLLPPPPRSRFAARRSSLGSPVCEGAGSRDGPGAAPAAESAGPAGLEAPVEARGPVPAGTSAPPPGRETPPSSEPGRGCCPRVKEEKEEETLQVEGAASSGLVLTCTPGRGASLCPCPVLPPRQPTSAPPLAGGIPSAPAACWAGDCCSLVAWHFPSDGVWDAAVASSGAWGGGWVWPHWLELASGLYEEKALREDRRLQVFGSELEDEGPGNAPGQDGFWRRYGGTSGEKGGVSAQRATLGIWSDSLTCL